MSGEIEVRIDKKTGEMTVEGMGYKGHACTRDIDSLLKELGGRTLNRRGKPEMVQLVGRARIMR